MEIFFFYFLFHHGKDLHKVKGVKFINKYNPHNNNYNIIPTIGNIVKSPFWASHPFKG